MKPSAFAAAVVALAGPSGCGAGGSSAGIYATWKANGASEAATPYHWEWNSDGVQDSFEVLASSASTFLQILLAGPTPLASGTYQCGQKPAQARMAYHSSGAQTAEAQSCSITLTEVGAPPNRPVTGTFEATVEHAGGGATVLTDGRFGLAKTQ
ncbi:MAG: hypothetical protein ABIS92_13080 [Polyangia bacterium]